jgi:hypothetical protein
MECSVGDSALLRSQQKCGARNELKHFCVECIIIELGLARLEGVRMEKSTTFDW